MVGRIRTRSTPFAGRQPSVNHRLSSGQHRITPAMMPDFSTLIFILPLLPLLAWMYVSYWNSVFSTWKKRGIPNLPGKFPYGSCKAFTEETGFAGELLTKMYNTFPKEPYFGIFQGSVPLLMIRDPEMIRLVLAKEFSHFRDRTGHQVQPDDYLAQHLFHLEGDKWRALRVKMSPVFTSGKLKGMFPLFVKCAEDLNKVLLSHYESTIDVKDFTGRFSTDVICSCAFGLDVDSIKDGEHPFRVMGKKFMKMEFRLISKLKMMKKRYFPFISSSRIHRVTPQEVEDFMVKAIKDTIEHREKTGLKRNDFIDLLMQIKSKGILNEGVTEEEVLEKHIEPIELTFELMAAQCFVFFIAGFDTSSSVQTYCLYEIALNPDIQERLHKEIETTIQKHGGITYKAVQEMEYLDMVVNETMRKYPIIMLARRCTAPFKTPFGHDIEKGERIIIPLWAIHHDPEYFPDPDKFDPERFSPENKASIHQFAFLPFGEGPRMCIGQRFGLLQTKMGIITILRKFLVAPCSETLRHLEFEPKMTTLTKTKRPIILKIIKREQP